MTLDNVKETLRRYLPRFVVINDVMDELLIRFGTAILSLRTQIDNTLTIRNSDITGHKFADDMKLLLSRTENDTDLRSALANGAAIHSARGTEDGILADVKRVTGDTNATATYYSKEDSGWWLGVTYPGIIPSTDTWDDTQALSYMGLKRFLRVSYANKSKRSDDELQTVMHTDIIPAIISGNSDFIPLRVSGTKLVRDLKASKAN